MHQWYAQLNLLRTVFYISLVCKRFLLQIVPDMYTYNDSMLGAIFIVTRNASFQEQDKFTDFSTNTHTHTHTEMDISELIYQNMNTFIVFSRLQTFLSKHHSTRNIEFQFRTSLMKFSWAISRVKWLSGEQTIVLKTISVLVLRVLV